jgi:hypothetical protein
MTAIYTDFTWHIDTKGYRSKGDRILPNGGELRAYRPLEKFETLFKSFIDECQSEKGVPDFVSKYGLLKASPGELISTRALGLPASMAAGGDSIREVIQQAKWMARWLRDRKPRQIPLTSLDAFLVTDGGEVRLRVLPSRLIDGIWLQAAQHITSGRDLRTCRYCGKLIEVGPGSGLRFDAKFCTKEHRTAYHNRERTKRL